MRINKYLSECGVCSRREADRLVESKSVTVNGVVAHTGMQVEDSDRVCIHGKEIRLQAEKTYLRFYKPKGIVCTAEKKEKDNIINYLNYGKRITYAGRLDKESEGLLLLTDDGELIQRLMRAKNCHEKEYEVSVDQTIKKTFLETMRKGIYLEELGVRTRPCQVVQTGEKSFRIILTQGLNRQIRRMCETEGYHVRALKRIRIANLMLNDLKPGEYRPLTKQELKMLQEIVKGNREDHG